MWHMEHRKAAALALVLFLLNLWIVRALLTTEYIAYMGSIEGARIAVSRWILENWGDLTWFPLWYGGIPFQNAYPPLCHMLVAVVAWLGNVTPALAYHWVTGIFYALGPVTLFGLALKLSGSRTYSFMTALLYSFISPAAFLIPIVHADLGSVWYPRRLQALVLYGEGPHVAAMTLLPLAVLLFIVALEKLRPRWWVLAALGIASVCLTNWLGATELGLAMLAWLLASHDLNRRKQWLWAILLSLYAYVIVMPWIPPSTVLAFIGSNEFRTGGYNSVLAQHWKFLAIGALALGAILWACRHFRFPNHLRFSLLFLYPIALVTISAISADPSAMPHRLRLQLIMEMGIVMVCAAVGKLVLDRFPSRVRTAALCLLLVLFIYPAMQFRKYAKILIRPADIHTTIEYREAKWLDQQMAGRRVMVPGSISFFLNAFTDTPQFTGGFDPGLINTALIGTYYQILGGETLEAGRVSVLWLRAFGVDAVAVSGPRSQEVYKPFRNPQKFHGVLAEMVREGDDVIYSVPRRSRSLAHVVRRSDLPARQPIDGLDIAPVLPYVSALEDPSRPAAEMFWRNRHAAVISARMEKDDILSVQISYHPGWTATVGGQPRQTFGDHLGQLIIEPQCEGPCSVELSYDGGSEMRLARLLWWVGVLGGAAWIVADGLKTTGHFRRVSRAPIESHQK